MPLFQSVVLDLLTRVLTGIYLYRAMCFIDFKMPVPEEEVSLLNADEEAIVSNRAVNSSTHQNGSFKESHRNFIMVPFKDPVLFMGHLSDKSIVIVEKPWLEAISQLPPPVYRHLYGT